MENNLQIHALGTGYTVGWENQYFPQIYKLYIIKGGEGYYKAEHKLNAFKKGYAYYLPCMYDWALSQNDENPLNHTYINFTYCSKAIINEVIEINLNDNIYFGDIFSFIDSLIHKMSSPHHEGFSCLMDVYTQTPQLNMVKNTLNELINLIASVYDKPQIDNEQLFHAVEYIHLHFTEKISLDRLCELAYMNKSYFIAKFTELLKCEYSAEKRASRPDELCMAIAKTVHSRRITVH